MSAETKPKWRLRASNERTTSDGHHEITISGEKEDVVALAGALQYGMKWIRMLSDGAIETSDVYTHPPAPTADPNMQNIWLFDPLPNGGKDVQMRLFRDDSEMRGPKDDWSRNNRDIYLQSIQGYTGDVYEQRAKRLAEAGFECLRSRRGKDGKYWEIWYLPSPWFGRGPIKDMKTSDEIKNWVMQTIGPGALTMGGEHWGLSLE